MIIAAGAINIQNNRRIYRSTHELSQSKIENYIAEFLAEALEEEGIIEKSTYKYAYISEGDYYFFMQTSKYAVTPKILALLRHLSTNCDQQDPLIYYSRQRLNRTRLNRTFA
jgi:hypothetical protein